MSNPRYSHLYLHMTFPSTIVSFFLCFFTCTINFWMLQVTRKWRTCIYRDNLHNWVLLQCSSQWVGVRSVSLMYTDHELHWWRVWRGAQCEIWQRVAEVLRTWRWRSWLKTISTKAIAKWNESAECSGSRPSNQPI